MRLIIVRHGQTEENKKKTWQGHIDGILSKEGEEQSEKLAERLEKEGIDVIYCSDLQRTRNTVKPLLERMNVPIHYVKELRERDIGVLEGLTGAEVKGCLEKNNMDINSNLITGETFDEVKERVAGIYKEASEKHEDETVLFVTHGGSISQLILHLFNYGHDKFKNYKPKNTSITEIKGYEKSLELSVFDDTTHL